jgi:hypothetical protein
MWYAMLNPSCAHLASILEEEACGLFSGRLGSDLSGNGVIRRNSNGKRILTT